ncbi:MAG: hypothetical protein DSZ27_07160 [Thiomicrospira sp.]|nr:MAG: hypothetical protein DSZ27_07160 [Thiomicrospira sp.]
MNNNTLFSISAILSVFSTVFAVRGVPSENVLGLFAFFFVILFLMYSGILFWIFKAIRGIIMTSISQELKETQNRLDNLEKSIVNVQKQVNPNNNS